MANKLHIISFDIPYPADYGGVIDVYYKIKALHANGVKIHLHCFEYHRPPAPELEAYCEKVYYYPRNISSRLLFHKLPYIVISRQSEELVQNLQKNNWPILAEGLHCTWILNERYWPNRKIIIRTHNIEHEYYQQLARAEKNLFKKYYFLNESTKLEAYEPILSNGAGIAAISEPEKEYFNKFHHTVKNIPAFHGHHSVSSKPGLGKFILYHGNLSIAENNQAAMSLAEILGDKNFQLVIAGSGPRKELKELCKQYSNIMLMANPTEAELVKLVETAQIHLLVTFQNTGLKLKLLNALFKGRHCLVNKTMVAKTGLEDTVCIVDHQNKEELFKKLDEYMQLEFTENDRKEREIMLADFFDEASVQKLMKMLFETP
jgi:glycosyltransferase involved in cell wall biosynthesis